MKNSRQSAIGGLFRRGARIVAICTFAAALAGCDKCGDYFWIDGTTPHSCKDVHSN